MLRLHMHVPYLLKKDINELYIAHALRSFAISIVGIFIPIFLLELGFSLAGIGIYMLVDFFVMTFAGYFTMKLAAKIGVKKNMFISGPLMILHFIMLYNIEFIRGFAPDISILLIVPIFHGIAASLYWTGFHVEFAKFSQAKKSAKQIGLINIFSTLASALGPFIGGTLILSWGFQPIFLIVMGLLLTSILPLFLSKEHHLPFKFKFKDVAKKQNAKFVFPFFAEGSHSFSLSIVWPIMLYLIYSNYSNVGGIYTFANAVFMVTTYYVSSKITSINKEKILKIGTYLHSLSILFRLFIQNLTGMYFAMGYAGASNAVMSNPFHSIFYNNSKKLGITSAIYFREFYLNLGRVAATLLFLILLFFFEPGAVLATMMFIGALVVLFRVNMKEL